MEQSNCDNTPRVALKTVVDKLEAQLSFCKEAKERFDKCNSEDSIVFYAGKIQELQWQIVQLQKHFDATGEVLKFKQESISVPVVNANERLTEDELELNTSDIFFKPAASSKKLYFLRYVVCLPLQKTVLQEQKTRLFKTDEVQKVESKRTFAYPRNGMRMCDSLRRGYLTVELYAEKKLKAPTLVGLPQRISLKTLLEESSIKGILTIGDNGEWDISYSMNIRRPQLMEEKDNFKMIKKDWVSVVTDVGKITRRVSIATMKASPHDSHHQQQHHHHHISHHSSRKRRNNRNHHRHHHRSDKIVEEQSRGITIISQSASDSNDSIEHVTNKQSDHVTSQQSDHVTLKRDEVFPPCEQSTLCNKVDKECSITEDTSDKILVEQTSEKPCNKNSATKLKKTISRRFTDLF